MNFFRNVKNKVLRTPVHHISKFQDYVVSIENIIARYQSLDENANAAQKLRAQLQTALIAFAGDTDSLKTNVDHMNSAYTSIDDAYNTFKEAQAEFNSKLQSIKGKLNELKDADSDLHKKQKKVHSLENSVKKLQSAVDKAQGPDKDTKKSQVYFLRFFCDLEWSFCTLF